VTGGEWQGVGRKQEVTVTRQLWNQERADNRIAAATKAGEHVWAAVVAYFVDPPLGPDTILDADSVMFPPSVGCFICEEEWSERIAHRRCKGEPR
jgi:hypothetical protein